MRTSAKFCKRGHAFVRYIRPNGKSGGCLECHKLRARTWNATHPERRKELKRDSYTRTAEHQKAKARQWYHDNKDRASATNRAWREANPDRVREGLLRWAKENPDRKRELQRLSDVRKRSRMALAHVPYGGLAAIYTRDDGRCVYCGDDVTIGLPNSNPKQATIDHVIPLVAGGPDVEENVVLACRRCNCIEKRESLEWREGMAKRVE